MTEAVQAFESVSVVEVSQGRDHGSVNEIANSIESPL